MGFRQASVFPTQFVDENGEPLVGGTISSFAAGTTNTQNMFTNSAGNSAGSLITLNSRGEPEVSGTTTAIFLDDSLSYKFVLKTSAGTSIYTVDNITVGNTFGGMTVFASTPFVAFKNLLSDNYDAKISVVSDGFVFETGGSGSATTKAKLGSNGYFLLDNAAAGGDPSNPLHVKGGAADYPILVQSTDAICGIELRDNTTGAGAVSIAASANDLLLTGNVKIPTGQLTVPGGISTGDIQAVGTSGDIPVFPIVVTAAGTTQTLPSSPTNGQIAEVFVMDFTNTVIARNGKLIQGLSENFTIDMPWACVTLKFSNDTYGWRLMS